MLSAHQLPLPHRFLHPELWPWVIPLFFFWEFNPWRFTMTEDISMICYSNSSTASSPAASWLRVAHQRLWVVCDSYVDSPLCLNLGHPHYLEYPLLLLGNCLLTPWNSAQASPALGNLSWHPPGWAGCPPTCSHCIFCVSVSVVALLYCTVIFWPLVSFLQ